MVLARHRDLTRVTKQGSPGNIQANMTMRILGTLLNFAANNYETARGQPILLVNAVRALSRNKAWHREYRRQVVIPDHKLADWYSTVSSLRQDTVRDYLLVLLLTGLRRNEAATLQWTNIDLNSRVLSIRPEVAKNYREHRLPLSDFLYLLFSRRKQKYCNSQYVFPGQGGRYHIVDSGHVISQVLIKSGCSFTLHDLRRTFLTTAAKLDIPHYAIKKLANHISGNDVTFGYIVVDVEQLREPMSQITNHFLRLFGINSTDLTAL
jgi:integrase